jgi:1-acyl-sn-glycerol-3-phosphate acyltransferase
MPRPIRLLAVGSAYVGFIVCGALIAHVLLPLALLGTRDPDARVAKAQALVQWCLRRYVGYMTMLRLLTLRAPDPHEGEAPSVIIANHPSLLDVIMLIVCIPRLTYVVKASWFANPFIGPMLRRCGHIPGPDDGTPAAGTLTMQRMLEALERGRTLLVFPEGTRSPRDELRTFSRGAFEAAARAGAPLVPYVISVDPPVLQKGRPWTDVPNEPVRFELRRLPAEHPDSWETSPKEAARRLRRLYLRELDLTDPSV